MSDERPVCKLVSDAFNGFCKVWSMPFCKRELAVVESNDSLNLLLYVRGPENFQCRFLLLRQPRTGKIFLEGGDGKTVSTVAGRFDKRATPAALAVSEAFEEAGVRVREDQIQFLNGGRLMYLSPGMNTERVLLAYAEVTSDQVEDGEHLRSALDEDEQCERVWMNIDEFENYACEDVRLFLYREWWFRKFV